MRKENLGDTVVIRSGYSLPMSDPAFSLIQRLQLSQPFFQSLKLSQCSGPVSGDSCPLFRSFKWTKELVSSLPLFLRTEAVF